MIDSIIISFKQKKIHITVVTNLSKEGKLNSEFNSIHFGIEINKHL